MKKIIALFALMVGLVSTTYGQGNLIFGNLVPDQSVIAPVFNVDGTTPLAGTGFSVQLFYGTAGTPESSLIALGSPISFQTGGFAGYFGGNSVQIPGVPAGSQAQLQVRAWDNAGGTITSFNSALVRGTSTSFLSPALAVDLAPSIPAMTGLTSFQLAAVPEPTTIALGVLGGLGLLARRRRNA